MVILTTQVAGLESLIIYMNENFFSKNGPAVNEHHYHITKKQYNEDIPDIYNIDKSKSHKINNHNFNDTHYHNKKQFVTNHLTNYITKQNNTTNTKNALNIKTFLRSIILQMLSEAITITLNITYTRNTII